MTKELLFSLTHKDFEIQTFRSGGSGGQNQNKRETGVRIIHNASGARGESREERSQNQNRKIAFKRLAETLEFKRWLNARVAEAILEESIDDAVDKAMAPENIKIEYLISDEM